MSFRARFVAAAATVVLLSTLAGTTTTMLPASAATKSCGPTCIDLFNRLNTKPNHPSFVISVLNRSATVGQPIVLSPSSNTNQGEDFTQSDQGTVHDFYLAGLVSAAFDSQFGNLEAFEIEYAPSGADSGFCIGVKWFQVHFHFGRVVLEPCGVSADTIWVADFANVTGGFFGLVNGFDPDPAHPSLLTGVPGLPLLTFPRLKFPLDIQEWNTVSGVLG